jgi:hypothetical protein
LNWGEIWLFRDESEADHVADDRERTPIWWSASVGWDNPLSIPSGNGWDLEVDELLAMDETKPFKIKLLAD